MRPGNWGASLAYLLGCTSDGEAGGKGGDREREREEERLSQVGDLDKCSIK